MGKVNLNTNSQNLHKFTNSFCNSLYIYIYIYIYIYVQTHIHTYTTDIINNNSHQKNISKRPATEKSAEHQLKLSIRSLSQ